MKVLLLTVTTLFSLTSFAAWNEVECEGRRNGQEIFFAVERAFPSNSLFRNAQLKVTEDGAQKVYDYRLTANNNRPLMRIEYFGSGARLEINYSPDRSPRTFWNYYGSLQSKDLRNPSIQRLNCRFF